jgi:hypothetical protein
LSLAVKWPSARLDFGRYRGDVNQFLADPASEPTATDSIVVRDVAGDDWVVLESFAKNVDPLAHKGWRGLQEWSSIHTLLITAGSAQVFLAALPDKPGHEVRDLVDSHGHVDCCYVGEVGRVGPTCYYQNDKPREATIGEESFRVVATVEHYAWAGNILDCSIGETARTVLPSTFIQQAAGLTFDMRGPSWLDATGAPVFTYYEEKGNDSRALVARASFLRDFLAERKLELIVFRWFERMQLSGERNDQHPFVESNVVDWLTTDLLIREGNPRRSERNLR